MAILVADCPHCYASKVTFDVLGGRAVEIGRQKNRMRVYGQNHPTSASIACQCRSCGEPIAASIWSFREGEVWPDFPNRVASMLASNDNVEIWDFTVIEIWPKPTPPTIPDHLPEAVERPFRQAEKNFTQEDCEDASATMYRKALEAGLRHLHPEAKGTLAKKIKDLVASHDLPKAIGEWCDEVRLIGNDGAHEDSGVTRADLTEARDFVDATLRYLFSLPAMIETRRRRAFSSLA